MHSTGIPLCRGGALSKLLIFLVIFAGVITACWVFFLPMILTSTLSKRTGFDVTVDKLTLNPFVAEVKVDGLVVLNPHTFARPEYLRVEHFRVRAPFKTLFSDRPEFDYVLVDIAHITFVRNTDGTLNAGLFYDRLFPPDHLPETDENGKPLKRPAPTPKPAVKPLPAPVTHQMPFLIHRLELKVANVSWDDESGRTPVRKRFNVAINQVFQDVTDAKQLFTPAVMHTVAPAATAIGGLIPGELGQVFGAAAGTPTSRDAAGKTGDNLKTMVDTLEESRKP